MVVIRASAYSKCIAAAVRGTAQRGVVQSTFTTAANLLFPSGFMLCLNATDGLCMPNGVQLSAVSDMSFFTRLRPGMSVLLGAERLVIEAVNCSLDLSLSGQWNAHIERPEGLDVEIVRRNGKWLRAIVDRIEDSRRATTRYSAPIRNGEGWVGIAAMAQYLCGRGIGLTPSGDDMLAGWMAVNWLLYGSMPALREACQQIMVVARRQTHVLSQCWLGYAAEGNLALPVKALLEAMTQEDEAELERATQRMLAMGATSGYDVARGILLGL